jgi:hypothetical protein
MGTLIAAILVSDAWNQTNPMSVKPKRCLAALKELCYQE